MKDLEKIKSEDLGCQVADANPGNFAIEQEVAQLVGATVPAPTAPSADDARELGAQLLVFLRRALLPIRSALRTALAAIYAHLDSRCTDYTPAAYAPYQPLPSYDPMGTPPTPRTLPNLLTALTAFSARKISNGSAPSDGIPDGTSLAHLLCSTAAWNAITELVDDNKGWLYDRPITFPTNLTKLVLGMGTIRRTTSGSSLSFSGSEFAVPYLKLIDHSATNNNVCFSIPNVEEVDAHSLTELQQHYSTAGQTLGQIFSGTNIKVIETNLEKFQLGWNVDYYVFCPSPKLRRLKFGKLQNFQPTIFYYQGQYTVPTRGEQKTFEKIVDLEIGAGTAISLNFANWTPDAETIAHQDFLPNFREHIALRLTANGSGKTLTLSQAVFDTIWNQDGTPKSTDPDSVIYQINQIIKTDKHWSVNRA